MHLRRTALLTALVLGCGLPGAAPATASMPRATHTVDMRDMTITPADAGGVIVVGKAWGPTWREEPVPVLGLWRNGTATTSVPVGQGEDIAVRVRADLCDGPPVMEVLLDGKVRLRQAVMSSTWHVARLRGPFQPGVREVGVRFVNDHRTSRCDRNLKVVAVRVERPDRDDYWSRNLMVRWEADDLPARAGSGRTYRTGGTGMPVTVLWGATSVGATADLQPGIDRILVGARGDDCEGHPTMALLIDGETVSTRTLTPGHSWAVDLPQPLTGGRHRFELAFLDPHHTATCDRVVRVLELLLQAPEAL